MSFMAQLGSYREGYEQGQEDILVHYSRALDEIYRLRRALAYEASVIKAHLDLKTFPKSRRETATKQVDRMRRAARGEGKAAYDDSPLWALRAALVDAGTDGCLTRSQFEAEASPSPTQEGGDRG